jgi:hypothetical protein
MRESEGLLDAVLALMGLELSVPDHSILSRKGENEANAN